MGARARGPLYRTPTAGSAGVPSLRARYLLLPWPLSLSPAVARAGEASARRAFLSASAAFRVSAATSFSICLARFSSQPFGSHSPGQPHLPLRTHEHTPVELVEQPQALTAFFAPVAALG